MININKLVRYIANDLPIPSLVFNAGVLSLGQFGYGIGAGGTITQQTNKATSVTLNTQCGQIIMNNANLASATSVAFTLSNTDIGADDEVYVWIKSGATALSYQASVDSVSANACSIVLRNYSGGGLAEAVIIGFSVRNAPIS